MKAQLFIPIFLLFCLSNSCQENSNNIKKGDNSIKVERQIELDSSYVLKDFINERKGMCFELRQIGLSKDDIPPGQEFKADSLSKALPNLKTCNAEIMNYIINHFRAMKSNTYHHCWSDYNYQFRVMDSLIIEGEMNLECRDISVNGAIYQLDTFNFNKILGRLKQIGR